jgi:hypothetical protein
MAPHTRIERRALLAVGGLIIVTVVLLLEAPEHGLNSGGQIYPAPLDRNLPQLSDNPLSCDDAGITSAACKRYTERVWAKPHSAHAEQQRSSSPDQHSY